MAAALFWMRTVSNGVALLSFGLFVTPLTDSFGWSRAEINLAASFGLVSVATTPLAGRLIDRFGARAVMLFSIPIVAAAYLSRFAMTDLWQFYASQTVIAAANTALTDMPVAVILASWYQRKRGRMVGTALMGANFGGLAVTPVVAVLIEQLGWRAAYAGIAAMLLFLITPAIFWFVRDRPEEVGLLPDDGGSVPAAPDVTSAKPALPGLTLRQALGTRAYWLCAAVFAISGLTFASILQQVVPHLEHERIDRSLAAFTISAVSLFGMGGKLGVGWLTDRLPARVAMQIALLLEVAGLVCLTLVGAWAGFLVPFVPLYGTGYASMGAVQPLLTAETFGTRAFASIHSSYQVFSAPSVAVATPLVGRVFDLTGSYNPAFYAIAALFALSALLLLFVRPVLRMGAPAVGPAFAE